MIDLFCGAGGTSTGALSAVTEDLGGKARMTAINHWPVAIETHTANHPDAVHLCTNLDQINPRQLGYGPREVDLLWASPECMHHSRARGGKPLNDQSRATAWCVTRFAEALQPGVILVENVPEFVEWGPIGAKGQLLPSRKGEIFRAWIGTLESCGYRVDWRLLRAADYGDPTIRKRLFVQAVRGRRKIIWPEPSHVSDPSGNLFEGKLPWRTAREIINWDHPTGSIFNRDRPLKEKTLRRIEAGLIRYGLSPFLVPQGRRMPTRDLDAPFQTVVGNARGEGLCVPYLVKVNHGNGADVNGDQRRVKGLDEPLPTLTAKNGWGLAEPYLIHMRGTSVCNSLDSPAPTVTGGGRHLGLVQPYLTKFYGTGGAGQSLDEPVHTITSKDRMGLVRPVLKAVDGDTYELDIHFRMLQPDELAQAQGFPKGYIFTGTKSDTVKQIGNAVPCGLARALCRAVLSQSS